MQADTGGGEWVVLKVITADTQRMRNEYHREVRSLSRLLIRESVSCCLCTGVWCV